MAEKQKGVVVATRGKHFDVMLDASVRIRCDLRTKVKRASESTTPVAVGDHVIVSLLDDKTGAIEEVEQRKSAFFRPTTGLSEIKQVIAANLDQIGIIASIASPELKTGLIDRLAIAGQNGGMSPLLVVNKVDLGIPVDLHSILEAYRAAGFTVVMTSTVGSIGIEELRSHLVDRKTLFAGHSGVGKSSLLNALLPEIGARTGSISDYSNKGKHTTTTVEMYPLPTGGFLVDSPGLKIMGLWEILQSELAYFYSEFEAVSRLCRFSGCQHLEEPDCAVKDAVSGGQIARFRYENYVQIRSTLEK